MADTIINVKSGFYNAVNSDRTYYAEDMNRPYHRLVADGVFATPKGDPSTDFQVFPGGGLTIKVAPGEGIFAGKWLENPATIAFTVPAVTQLNKRIDSVIIQIDERASGRVGSVVYRTGTAVPLNPTAPQINQVSGVTEYRVANVLVEYAASSSGIQKSAITDLRGSKECPWVTAIIDQPDTSALFEQYQAAYTEELEAIQEGGQAAVETERARWEAFFSEVSEALNVSMQLVTLKSSTELSATTKTIPVGIAAFDKATDLLQVFINGYMAAEGDFWSLDTAGTTITFENALGTGASPDRVDVVCYKSVVNANIGSIQNALQALDARLTAEVSDTGWITSGMSYLNNAAAYDEDNAVSYRKIGKRVQLRGAIKTTRNGINVLSLPKTAAPSQEEYFTSQMIKTTGIGDAVVFSIGTDGIMKMQAGSVPTEADKIPVCFSWLTD